MNRKTLYVIIVMLFPIFVSAQKLQKPDIDKITGDTTFKTSIEDIADNDSFSGTDELSCSVMTKKNRYALFVYITNGGSRSASFSIHKGSKLIMRLSGDSTITLQSVTDQTTTASKFKPKRNSCFGLYPLNPDEMSILKNSLIPDLKIETSNGIFDYKLNSANSHTISKQITLIINR